ncbi:hypothetical protein Dimus_000326 [Dionaea muscipula]
MDVPHPPVLAGVTLFFASCCCVINEKGARGLVHGDMEIWRGKVADFMEGNGQGAKEGGVCFSSTSYGMFASGLALNNSKSSMLCAAMDEAAVDEVRQVTGFMIGGLPVTYSY